MKKYIFLITVFSCLFAKGIAAVPPIDSTLSAKIEPVLADWLQYYGLDITDFELVTADIRFIPEHIQSLDKDYGDTFFVMELEDEDKKYKPLLREYSPDKRYSIPIYEHILEYDPQSAMYHIGFDDSQNIWLYNTKAGLGYMIHFFGASSIGEAAYWIDDSTAILVGKEFDRETKCIFYLFDFKKMKKSYYYNNKTGDYDKSFCRHVLKNRGLKIAE